MATLWRKITLNWDLYNVTTLEKYKRSNYKCLTAERSKIYENVTFHDVYFDRLDNGICVSYTCLVLKKYILQSNRKHSLSNIWDSAISSNFSEVGHQLNQPENQFAPPSSVLWKKISLHDANIFNLRLKTYYKIGEFVDRGLKWNTGSYSYPWSSVSCMFSVEASRIPCHLPLILVLFTNI